jgi:hypothetical protein
MDGLYWIFSTDYQPSNPINPKYLTRTVINLEKTSQKSIMAIYEIRGISPETVYETRVISHAGIKSLPLPKPNNIPEVSTGN